MKVAGVGLPSASPEPTPPPARSAHETAGPTRRGDADYGGGAKGGDKSAFRERVNGLQIALFNYGLVRIRFSTQPLPDIDRFRCALPRNRTQISQYFYLFCESVIKISYD